MEAPASTLTIDSFDLSSVPEEERSMAERLALLVEEERERIIEDLAEDQAKALEYDWEFWSRPDQQEPEAFASGVATVWFVRAGRGFGKTRTGAETLRKRVRAGLTRRSGIIAPTAGDARDILIEGETGILSVCPPWERPHYEPSKRRITWQNGAVTHVYSADEPDRLRGPQHDFLWGDEPASWRFGEEAWDNAEFGLRLGRRPQALLTGTPKPLPWLKKLWGDPETVITTGSSYRNIANLAETFIRRILKKYEGSRLGLQELWARVLEDVEGALWSLRQIDSMRFKPDPERGLWLPDLDRIVVGVDPAASSGPDADFHGIIVAGRDGSKETGTGYVLDDFTLQGAPHEWATAVGEAFDKWQADKIVAEKNQGGDMVKTVITSVRPDLARHVVLVHASRGKKTRAEPIAALYGDPQNPGTWKGGRIRHLPGLTLLETQQSEWVPGEDDDSPDRVDALVWALTDLFGSTGKRKVKVHQ